MSPLNLPNEELQRLLKPFADLGATIATQANASTCQPVFQVQYRTYIEVSDTEDYDDIVTLEDESYDPLEKESTPLRRIPVVYSWVTDQTFFTRQAALNYMTDNWHNLSEYVLEPAKDNIRIYVESAYRNEEFVKLREAMLAAHSFFQNAEKTAKARDAIAKLVTPEQYSRTLWRDTILAFEARAFNSTFNGSSHPDTDTLINRTNKRTLPDISECFPAHWYDYIMTGKAVSVRKITDNNTFDIVQMSHPDIQVENIIENIAFDFKNALVSFRQNHDHKLAAYLSQYEQDKAAIWASFDINP